MTVDQTHPIYDNINPALVAKLQDSQYDYKKAKEEALLNAQEMFDVLNGLVKAIKAICEKQSIPLPSELTAADKYLNTPNQGVRRPANFRVSNLMDAQVLGELKDRITEQHYVAEQKGDPTGMVFGYEQGRSAHLYEPQQGGYPNQQMYQPQPQQGGLAQSITSKIPFMGRNQYIPPSAAGMQAPTVATGYRPDGSTFQYYSSPPPGIPNPQKMPGQLGWDMGTGQPVDQQGNVMQSTSEKLLTGAVQKAARQFDLF